MEKLQPGRNQEAGREETHGNTQWLVGRLKRIETQGRPFGEVAREMDEIVSILNRYSMREALGTINDLGHWLSSNKESISAEMGLKVENLLGRFSSAMHSYEIGVGRPEDSGTTK